MALIRRVRLETLTRVVADALMINVAFLTALASRFLLLFTLWDGQSEESVRFYAAIWQESLRLYRNSAWLLTLICLAVFYASGFYTYGRAYRSRYKALIVFQAVGLSYLSFGFLSYFLRPIPPFPRGALVGSWLLTLVLVGGMRAGAALWARIFWAEARRDMPRPATIRHVLVIGGAGYIGSVLVRRLLDRGYHVTVLDALLYGDHGVRELCGRPGFDLIRDDTRNIEAVVSAMQYADAVVHLGALVGDPACALDERLTLEINLAATRMIAEAARGFGVQRFVFASTCSVYGASDHVLDERSALNPVSLYARTKVESERILLALNDDGFAPIILRFGTVYGLSHRPRFDLVVNLLTAQAVIEKRIVIQGGDQWRPFIHVSDAAEAIIKCLEAPLILVKGQIFNVGSDDQNYQIAQVGQLIRELVPGVDVVLQHDESDRRNYRVAFGKIQKHLGFTPRYTLADGILEIKAAIESGRIPDYRDTRHSNYLTLTDEGQAELIRRTRLTPIYASGHPAARSLPASTA